MRVKVLKSGAATHIGLGDQVLAQREAIRLAVNILKEMPYKQLYAALYFGLAPFIDDALRDREQEE